ncbi:uncharacterized protein LOC115983616 [Quercus lobata]|uniref:uncharacterized protein LOC115983616 n=1 Tax=Quercus lobata TaxID=97700 RepID=UPI00124438FE|nr:uncharacterized protein LOC115983616 [Quercus lobata]XP_030962202.1 uncharacterized protein LOC115983616 [Quercus lobata]XP_030962203.1 uncharacterized protein LOC115983616 [Quercus lobata]XP_030962204.1 uncharacterized protein LOC115983616 [Quercus lobata]
MEESSDNKNNNNNNYVGDSTTDDESTCVAIQNQNDNQNSQAESEAVAKGISSTLGTVISDFDSRAQATLTSQDQLSSSIDRLTRELDQLLEDAPLPFIMQHAAKISGVRKRVSSLNSVLKSIQRRVDNIDRMLSAGMLHEKMASESAGQH